jgi:hypothetical protein
MADGVARSLVAATKPKARGTKRSRESTTSNTNTNSAAGLEDSSATGGVEKRPARNTPNNYVVSFAESYVEFASSCLFDKLTKRLGNYHQFPLEHMSALAYLKSPVRKPMIIETWSPMDIAMFEAALAVHGKEFHIIQRHVATKSTKEIIDFYYIWKKTSHYTKWKQEFVPAEFGTVVSPTTTITTPVVEERPTTNTNSGINAVPNNESKASG